MASTADKLRRAQSMTMPEDDLRARSSARPAPAPGPGHAGPTSDPAVLAELARIRIASERHHSFQFWRRVVPLFLLLGGLPLLILVVMGIVSAFSGGDTLSDAELQAMRERTAAKAPPAR